MFKAKFSVVCAAVVACVAPFLTPVTASASAAGGAPAAGSSCDGGLGHVARPVATRSDSAGGKFYDYDFGNGQTSTQVEAPSNFDALTASDQDRAHYALPSRPVGGAPEEVTSWTSAMAGYRGRAETLVPYLCYDDGVKPVSASVLPTEGSCTQGVCGNYSGYQGTQGPYNAVTGNVVVPQDGALCASASHASTWVGLGGQLQTRGLMQAGTITRTLGGGATPYTEAFYEWVAGSGGGTTVSPITSPSWQPLPGATLFERVQFNAVTGGTNYYVGDVNNGNNRLTMTVSNQASYYDSTHAGFITENHLSLESNPKHAPWVWSHAVTIRTTGSSYGVQTQAPISYGGVNSSNTLVEYPSAFTGTASFNDNWAACS